MFVGTIRDSSGIWSIITLFKYVHFESSKRYLGTLLTDSKFDLKEVKWVDLLVPYILVRSFGL